MSDYEEHDRSKQPPNVDSSLIDTRLREVERQRAEETEYQRDYNLRQLRFNKWLTIFTGLLFITSVASDILMWRYVGLTKESADAAKSAASTADATLREIRSSGQGTKHQVGDIITHLESVATSMGASVIQNRNAMEASGKQSRAAIDRQY